MKSAGKDKRSKGIEHHKPHTAAAAVL